MFTFYKNAIKHCKRDKIMDVIVCAGKSNLTNEEYFTIAYMGKRKKLQ